MIGLIGKKCLCSCFFHISSRASLCQSTTSKWSNLRFFGEHEDMTVSYLWTLNSSETSVTRNKLCIMKNIKIKSNLKEGGWFFLSGAFVSVVAVVVTELPIIPINLVTILSENEVLSVRAHFILHLQLNTKFKLKSPQTNTSVTIFSSLRKLLDNKRIGEHQFSCGYLSPTCRDVCLSWWKWICKYNSRKPYFHLSLHPFVFED